MRNVLVALGKGLAAGALGTVAMTLSETLEMRLTGRAGSTVPGQVGAKLFDMDPDRVGGMDRLNTGMHWGHGILAGSLRGALTLAGLRGVPATAVHFGLVWGGDAMLYWTLGIAPAPWRWKTRGLVTDVSHKGVYALAAGAAFDAIA